MESGVSSLIWPSLGQWLIKTAYSDNHGLDFASLSQLEGVEIYDDRPYTSAQRGTNEHFNGCLRQKGSRSTKLFTMSDKRLLGCQFVARKLDNY